MRAFIKRCAERIDSASLRERAVIFVGLAAVLVFVVNAALIEPLRTRQKTFAAASERMRQESVLLQSSLQRMVQSRGQDADSLNRARQAAAQSELAKLNARLIEEQRRFTPPERMRAVLAGMFERNTRLGLIDLRTLPAAPVANTPAGAGGSPALFRHGIELTVSGTYADLYEYLRKLEKQLPTQLYWGRADLAVAEYPSVTLKLTIYTVSFDRAWLVV
jgi:MSHA biogenesis protein MshJ